MEARGCPGIPPENGYWQGCRILLEKCWCSTQIIIDWRRFLATAVFISVTVTIMLNDDINVSESWLHCLVTVVIANFLHSNRKHRYLIEFISSWSSLLVYDGIHLYLIEFIIKWLNSLLLRPNEIHYWMIEFINRWSNLWIRNLRLRRQSLCLKTD